MKDFNSLNEAELNSNIIDETEEVNTRPFPFWRILYRNLIFIIIATIIGTGCGILYNMLTTKTKYTASCSVLLYVGLDVDDPQYNPNDYAAYDLSLSKLYLPTVISYIKTDTVVDYANENIYNGEGEIALGSVSTTFNEDSLIFAIRYTDLDETTAKAKLRAFVESAKRCLESTEENGGSASMVANKYNLTETQNDYVVTSARGGKKFIVLGLAIGLVGSILIAFLRYLLDSTMKSSSELEEITGVSVIAYIDKA